MGEKAIRPRDADKVHIARSATAVKGTKDLFPGSVLGDGETGAIEFGLDLSNQGICDAAEYSASAPDRIAGER